MRRIKPRYDCLFGPDFEALCAQAVRLAEIHRAITEYLEV